MARKTKAQIEQERQAEQEQIWEDFVRDYHKRYAAILYGVLSDRRGHVEEDVNDDPAMYRFTIDHDKANAYCDEWLPVYPDYLVDIRDRQRVMENMQHVEFTLSEIELWEKGILEREMKKRAALAKLTDEEKKLLGVS